MDVIIYTRVSTEDQKENGFSLQDQERRIRKYCDEKGFDIIAHYQDDASAKDFNRPQLEHATSISLVLKPVSSRFLYLILFFRFQLEEVMQITYIKYYFLEYLNLHYLQQDRFQP